jgi:hypothetical protein
MDRRARRGRGGRSFFEAVAAAVAVAGAVILPAWAAGAASHGSSTFRPVVVERLVHAFIASVGVPIIGPRTLSLSLPEPTVKGDLLVAAIDDGVLTSGMVHPHYLFAHWDLGVTTIGGETQNDGQGGYETGGLQASVYFYPDNPGGIRTIKVAAVPPSTETVVTVTIAELTGVPEALSVDATGSYTSGPTASDYEQHSAVVTTTATTGRHDLVVALFNNGGNAPNGERYVTQPGWTLIGEDTTPNNWDQPILANFKVTNGPGLVSQSERYLGGFPIDNCAVIVAFK